MALVMVLWTLIVLSLIAAGFMSDTRTGMRVTRNLLENAKAEALADAGLNRAILGLTKPIDEGGWRVDGTVYAWRFDGADIRVSVQDEGGKLDLNNAADNLLQGLFVSVGVDREGAVALVDAIADFRDGDELRRLSGAEADDYRAAGLPQVPKNDLFVGVEELGLVLGMTETLYQQVAPALTIYSEDDVPFSAVSPPEVLAALASALDYELEDTSELAEAELGDDDLRPLPTSLEILQEGPAAVRSDIDVYTIHVEAHIDTGAVFAREAVVSIYDSSREPFEIREWRQGRRLLFEDDSPTE